MLSCFAAVKFNGDLEYNGTTIVLAYQHDGYVIKLPLFMATKAETKEAALLTLGTCLVANIFTWFSHKKLLERKSKLEKKDNTVHFMRYQSNFEAALKSV